MTPRSLLLTCGLLSCVIGAEVYIGLNGDANESQAATAPVRSPGPTRQPQAALASVADRWVSVVLGRPLFAPDRRPVAGATAVDPGLPRLSGVIISNGSAVAIFQPTGDGKPVAARAGDTVGGWEVTDISAERVGVRKANDVAVLRPRFANLQGNAAPPGSPARPRWETAAANGVLRERWSNPQLQP